jgi:uncharacterized protein (DUF433 family)
MSIRLPVGVRRGVERLASQFGHKPAQIGARLIEEGLRRREFPQVDLRETPAGRVAYIQGTRLAVYWVVREIRAGMKPEEFARKYEVLPVRVREALAYAEAFAEEIERDLEEAEANRRWVEMQDSAWQTGHRVNKGGANRPK